MRHWEKTGERKTEKIETGERERGNAWLALNNKDSFHLSASTVTWETFAFLWKFCNFILCVGLHAKCCLMFDMCVLIDPSY